MGGKFSYGGMFKKVPYINFRTELLIYPRQNSDRLQGLPADLKKRAVYADFF